ncbi:MAG TPA: NUDIX hydrolase [Intrasporangium sp.]|nr:NUDIX hydrolase [Intrasporangium sp.]
MSVAQGASTAAYLALWDDAREVLAAWAPPDPGQARLRDEFLALLEQGPSAVRRDGGPAHLTAGVIVLDPGLRHVLLTHHRKADAWFQFGGHLEPVDQTLHGAAIREGREESGLAGLTVLPDVVHLDRHALPASFGSCREHLDVRFAAVADPRSRHAVSEESLDVRWWPVEALPPGAAADLGPLIEAALVQLSPLDGPTEGGHRDGSREARSRS